MDVSAVIDSEIAFGGDTSASISSQGGGAAANVATWLAFNKQSVYFVARVGDDQPGEFLLAELDKYGVAHPNKKYPDQKTGTVVVIIHDSGERTMFPDSGANSGLSKSDLPPLVGIDAVFISGYALINPRCRPGRRPRSRPTARSRRCRRSPRRSRRRRRSGRRRR